MAKWYRNREGYADSTAAIAILRVSREERKVAMGKKRNCRRTMDESVIHEKAVKMRKMTDEQLVHYVEDRVEKDRSEGFNCGKKKGAEQKKPGDVMLAEFIEDVGKISGIGQVTMEKIRGLAQEGGYIAG